YRAFAAGAARFARGEGIWHGQDRVYVACTTGGREQIGQVFTYRPSPWEGTDRERTDPGTLELFIEPNDPSLVEMADNLTVAADGDLFICADGPDTNGLTRVTPEGRLERFAMNRANDSELAGPCFSPDGSTLFVNIQRPGATLAITGPWRRG
ncbi:MAG: alkaline phosphatase PhoX, partial [Planctomycetota bacterium]|nr:alkaline phosphatase PhoX [Planctomycetota bacterium]